MALDRNAIETPGSPEWWLVNLTQALTNKDRQDRLKKLKAYSEGKGKLPVGAPDCSVEFSDFQLLSRRNLAGLINGSLRARMRPCGIRTSADSDETGDAEAWRIFTRARVNIALRDAIKNALDLGEGYIIVGDINPGTKMPLVTSEDPRECITVEDPATGETIAGLKVLHDPIRGRDYAYLYLPGQVHVAYVENKRFNPFSAAEAHTVFVNVDTWSWDETESSRLTRIGGLLPIVKLENEGGIGNFEPHIPAIDTIHYLILMRLVISSHQAFKTYAAIGLPDIYPVDHPQAGEKIDYSQFFKRGPGRVWKLPEGSNMWESGTADLTPLSGSLKDELGILSADSETPMHVLSPESANQSAAGSDLSKEGQVNKARDRIELFTDKVHRIIQLCFLWLGDAERADIDHIELLWEDPRMPNMTERYDAGSKATDVPWRTKMVKLYGFSPSDVDRMETERASDALLANAAAQQAKPAAQPA